MRIEPITDAILRLNLLEECQIDNILEQPKKVKIDEKQYLDASKQMAVASADFITEASETYLKGRNLVQELMGLSSASRLPNKAAQGMFAQIARRHPHGIGAGELSNFVKRNFGRKIRKDAVQSYLDQMEKELKVIRKKGDKYTLA